MFLFLLPREASEGHDAIRFETASVAGRDLLFFFSSLLLLLLLHTCALRDLVISFTEYGNYQLYMREGQTNGQKREREKRERDRREKREERREKREKRRNGDARFGVQG